VRALFHYPLFLFSPPGPHALFVLSYVNERIHFLAFLPALQSTFLLTSKYGLEICDTLFDMAVAKSWPYFDDLKTSCPFLMAPILRLHVYSKDYNDSVLSSFFRDTVAQPLAATAFKKYLNTRKANQLLEFWLEAQEYAPLSDKTSFVFLTRRDKANRIFESFFKPESPIRNYLGNDRAVAIENAVFLFYFIFTFLSSSDKTLDLVL